MIGLYFFIFLLGLAVGSFLNVLIDRLPREEQVFRGRSHCDSCRRELGFWDLIPLFSWIALRGRCRYCHSPIPWQNPVVELLTGVIFVGVMMAISATFRWGEPWFLSSISLRFNLLPSRWMLPAKESPSSLLPLGWLLELVYWWIITSSLIVIFFADLRYRIIPDAVLFPAASIVSLRLLVEWLTLGKVPTTPILSAVAAMVGFLSLVVITHGRGMGLGDVKFVGLMGLLLGYPKILVALYLAFFTGATLGVTLIILGKRRWGQMIAFGPFLVLGTMVALIYGEPLIMEWYKLFA